MNEIKSTWIMQLKAQLRNPDVVIDGTIAYIQAILNELIDKNVLEFPPYLQVGGDGAYFDADEIKFIYKNVYHLIDYNWIKYTTTALEYELIYSPLLSFVEFGLKNNGLFIFSNLYNKLLGDKNGTIWQNGDGSLFIHSPHLESLAQTAVVHVENLKAFPKPSELSRLEQKMGT